MPDFPLVFQTMEPQFLIEKEFRHLLPQPVPKPLKQPRGKKPKAAPAKKQTKKPADVVTMFEKMRIEADVAKVCLPDRDVSVCDLSDATDDDADLSAIVDMICQRKNKPATCLAELEQKTLPDDAKPETNAPLPNFSFDISVSHFMEASNLSGRLGDSPTDSTSTPVSVRRPLPSHLLTREEQDSFATPPPLADRFSRLHL